MMDRKLKQLVFEGFYDTRSGNEFGMPMFLISPCVQMTDDAGNAGHAEQIVEDYFIDWDVFGSKPRGDSGLSTAQVRRDFRSAKVGHRRFKYWKAVVEYDPKHRIEFVIKERVGF